MKSLLFLLLLATNALCLDLLLLHADTSYYMDVYKKLSLGFNVTVYNGVSTQPPTPQYLSQFDVAFVYDDNNFLNSGVLGDNLATFVEAGNGVVFAMFDFLTGYSVGGRMTSYAAIDASSPSGVNGVYTLVPVDVTHPILREVRSFSGGSKSYRSGTWNSLAHQVALWSDGKPLIGTRQLSGGGRRVDLAFFPPSSDIRNDFWNSQTDGVKIMVNAINWASSGGQCTGMDCLSCTKGGCQWCLDTNMCTMQNATICEDRITIPTNCPFNCGMYSSCSTCLDPSNAGGCTWCLTTTSCIPRKNQNTCSDAINKKEFCTTK